MVTIRLDLRKLDLNISIELGRARAELKGD